MTTFDLLRKSGPSFALLGLGLYFLFVASIPSWRRTCVETLASLSRLVQDFGNPNRPAHMGDLDEKAIFRTFTVVGYLFLLLGIAGIFWTAWFV